MCSRSFCSMTLETLEERASRDAFCNSGGIFCLITYHIPNFCFCFYSSCQLNVEKMTKMQKWKTTSETTTCIKLLACKAIGYFFFASQILIRILMSFHWNDQGWKAQRDQRWPISRAQRVPVPACVPFR